MATWSKDYEKVLMQPFEYILKSSGKQIRSQLVLAFNEWLAIPEEQLIVISEVIEMLHNASLLVDDIEDNSVLRRGNPSAHNIFGLATTLNSANYVYFLALHKIINQFPASVVKEAVEIYAEQMIELHRGQGLDIHWRDSYQCPTEEEYIDMIRRKTGGLFNMGVGLMQLFSRKEGLDLSHLVQLMGQFFQIRDDYANLISSEVRNETKKSVINKFFFLTQYADNKSYCEDLTEGKFSFPIIHSIRSQSDDTALLEIVRKRTSDIELKRFAVRLMEKSGSFEYTIRVLTDLEQKIRQEIEKLGGNSLLSTVIDSLSLSKLK